MIGLGDLPIIDWHFRTGNSEPAAEPAARADLQRQEPPLNGASPRLPICQFLRRRMQVVQRSGLQPPCAIVLHQKRDGEIKSDLEPLANSIACDRFDDLSLGPSLSADLLSHQSGDRCDECVLADRLLRLCPQVFHLPDPVGEFALAGDQGDAEPFAVGVLQLLLERPGLREYLGPDSGRAQHAADPQVFGDAGFVELDDRGPAPASAPLDSSSVPPSRPAAGRAPGWRRLPATAGS